MIFIEINFNNIDKYQFIIDIRNEENYERYHLKNSINIPFMKLIIEPEKYLDKNKKYLLVCEYGIKSKKTSTILNNIGYKTDSLKNGLN